MPIPATTTAPRLLPAPRRPAAAHRVAVLAYPGMSVFETGIVTEVFGLPGPS